MSTMQQRCFVEASDMLHILDTLSLPKVKSFDPDQPRDERGRWTGGYGSSSAEERLERFNSKEFKAGHGIVLTGKELRAAMLDKMQQMCVWSNTNVGSSGVNWNTPEALYLEMQAQKWAFNDFDMRVLGSGFMWRNGNIQITASTDRYLKEGLEQIVNRVEELQQQNPVARLDVRIGERGQLGRNDLGAAIRGGSVMWLSPTNLLQQGRMSEIDPRGIGASGWWMPSAKDNTYIDSVVSHEWGHLLDNSNYNLFIRNHDLVQNNISQYGRESYAESYAELFSEWHLTGGKTDNPAVQLAAKEYKWK